MTVDAIGLNPRWRHHNDNDNTHRETTTMPNLDADTAWMARASCRGADPAIFNPDRGRNVPPEAKETCRRCPVADACRAYAVADPTITGYWGGTSYNDRRAIRKAEGFDANASRSATMTKPINHGTLGGYQAHKRRGEVACGMCKDANARYKTERYAAKRAGVAA